MSIFDENTIITEENLKKLGFLYDSTFDRYKFNYNGVCGSFNIFYYLNDCNLNSSRKKGLCIITGFQWNSFWESKEYQNVFDISEIITMIEYLKKSINHANYI